MAVEIAPNEGKDYVAQNAISGRTVYAFAIYGQTVAGGTITATSTLAGLQQETNVARVSLVLGASSAGVMAFPGVTLTAGASAHSNITAWGIASASSGGVAIFIWDTAATRDMSVTGSQLVIPTLSYFFKNPGE